MTYTMTAPKILGKSHLDDGAALLARVFQNDPMMKYLAVDTTDMIKKTTPFYRANIRLGFTDGEVYTLPSLEGIAVWLKPGNTDFTFGQFLRSGLLTATFSMGLKSFGRLMRSASFFDDVKKKAISGPHWVLVFLGVDPIHQNKGLGGHLIQPILAKADAEGLSCYLDSTNKRNLTFYQRHGFKIAANVKVPKGGPEIWAMVRQPGSY